jgi:hypothetical protein
LFTLVGNAADVCGGAVTLFTRMIIKQKGYIALFDVLGFSDRVMRGALTDLDAYIKTISNNAETHNGVLGAILFSDTVVLYTFDDSQSAFDSIVSVSCAVFYDLLLAGVPVRGAISFGEFARSDREEHGTVIAGRPLIEAHDFESRSQWIGIMFAPSVLEQRPEISETSCALLPSDVDPGRPITATVKLMFQHCDRIPLEDASGRTTLFDGFAIVPLNHAQTMLDLKSRLDEVCASLHRLRQLAPNVRSQEKYRYALEWLTGIRSNFVRVFKL